MAEEVLQQVKDANADYGVAFDGDGDRTVIIKNDGSVLWPDELMIIFAKSILKEVDKWIKRQYSLDLDQFKVDKSFFNSNNFEYH